MNYIIDPMWFYWVGVVDDLRGVLSVAAITLGVVALVLLVWAFCEKVFDGEDDIAKTITKKAFTLMVMAAVFGLLMVAVPSKQTLIEMQVARFATYENAEWTVETIKQAVDYIVEAVGSLK